MKVSIIVPVYNVSPYIQDCLKSVMRQTYRGSIECILIDDCGTDNSIAIAERMIDEYKGTIQFKVIHHTHNRGLSAARNTGTIEAIGEYLFYLDSDDEITEDCIEKLMAVACKSPRVEMVQGNACRHCIDKTSYILVNDISMPLAVTNGEVRECLYQRGQFYVNCWNKLLKRDLIIKNQIFCQEGLLYEDNLWLFYLLKYLEVAAFIPDITYHQKKRTHSITSTADIKTKGYNFMVIYRDIIEHLTPGREEEEFRYYSPLVGEDYIQYIHAVPEFENVYKQFRESSKQYGNSSVRWNLVSCHFWGRFEKGWGIYSFIKKCKIAIARRIKRLQSW